MNICPCLKEIIDNLLKKTKHSKSYEGTREFQQEEFINPNYQDHQEISYGDAIDSSVKKNEPKLFEHRINQTLQDQIISQNYETDSLEVKLILDPATFSPMVPQQKDIEQLLRQELSLTTQQAMKNISYISEPRQLFQQNSKINFSSFALNIDSFDPYFPLLTQKTRLLPEYFCKTGQQLEVNQPNKTNLDIQIIQASKGNTFLIKYELNCEYSYYVSIMKNEKLLYSLSTQIAEARVLESFKPNLTLNTLKFKRIGSFQSRDCYYIKYQNGSKREHWQIYINDDKHPLSSDVKTCQIFCAKNIYQSNERHLLVFQYLQIDFQTINVLNVVPKLTSYFRDYLNNLQDYILDNYERQLA